MSELKLLNPAESPEARLAAEVLVLSGRVPHTERYLRYLSGLRVCVLEERLRILRAQSGRRTEDGRLKLNLLPTRGSSSGATPPEPQIAPLRAAAASNPTPVSRTAPGGHGSCGQAGQRPVWLAA